MYKPWLVTTDPDHIKVVRFVWRLFHFMYFPHTTWFSWTAFNKLTISAVSICIVKIMECNYRIASNFSGANFMKSCCGSSELIFVVLNFMTASDPWWILYWSAWQQHEPRWRFCTLPPSHFLCSNCQVSTCAFSASAFFTSLLTDHNIEGLMLAFSIGRR